MKIPYFRRPGANNAVDTSTATTAVPSPVASTPNAEKDSLGNHTSLATTTYAMDSEKNVVEATPIQEAAALDKLGEEPEYPTGIKLFIISLALCVSVFLVALVRIPLASFIHIHIT